MLGHDRTCCIRGMRGPVPWVWSFEGTFWEEHFLPFSHINQRVVWMQHHESLFCFLLPMFFAYRACCDTLTPFTPWKEMRRKTTLISFPEIYLEYDVIVTKCAKIYFLQFPCAEILWRKHVIFHSSYVIGCLNYVDEFPIILIGLVFFGGGKTQLSSTLCEVQDCTASFLLQLTLFLGKKLQLSGSFQPWNGN